MRSPRPTSNSPTWRDDACSQRRASERSVEVRASTRIVAAISVVAVAFAPAAAGARGGHTGRGEPRLSFQCTMAVTHLGSKIRVVYRMNSDGPHQAWRVRLRDDGVLFASVAVDSDGAGNFRIWRAVRNRRGADTILGVGRNVTTGGACSVRIDA
jgi:hypothetical protein